MLILRREAANDIKAAYEWYEGQREHLGRAFIDEVESRMEKIGKNPGLYAQIYKKVRRALCKRFPYSIYFVKPGEDVVVIGILHQSRNPVAWQSRNSVN